VNRHPHYAKGRVYEVSDAEAKLRLSMKEVEIVAGATRESAAQDPRPETAAKPAAKKRTTKKK